jgi:hypothetical protein
VEAEPASSNRDANSPTMTVGLRLGDDRQVLAAQQRPQVRSRCAVKLLECHSDLAPAGNNAANNKNRFTHQ